MPFGVAIGLLLFHGDVEQYIPPRKGQRHALRVVREVLAHEAQADPPGLFHYISAQIPIWREDNLLLGR